ncbi:MAG: hypothetical protein H6718_09410 [Polyangiaceae bacterium]|nr:hypothetical protein [Myxococcales bacterium]MCB9585604.1 hypothetical protein [Polyangiaceae bacterium]MCB9606381.1 hypothetical protein [Polyangiaceae bacterium]
MSESPLERTVSRVAQALREYYRMDHALDIRDFVREGEPGSRETLVLRQRAEDLELCLVLPPQEATETDDADHFMQVVEGVSHFLLVVERARVDRPTTQLELELQAEVDKFVILSQASDAHARKLHTRLYEQVRFIHAEGSEAGARYRLANSLAARFVHRHLGHAPHARRQSFRHFYRVGQSEKIRLAS